MSYGPKWISSPRTSEDWSQTRNRAYEEALSTGLSQEACAAIADEVVEVLICDPAWCTESWTPRTWTRHVVSATLELARRRATTSDEEDEPGLVVLDPEPSRVPVTDLDELSVDQVERLEAHELILRLATCPPFSVRERQVVALMLIEGLSADQVAERLQRPPEAIWRIRQNAYDKLTDLVNPQTR